MMRGMGAWGPRSFDNDSAHDARSDLPGKAKLVGTRDDSWYFMGRTVAIRYVMT
jgi:hypothetical protein